MKPVKQELIRIAEDFGSDWIGEMPVWLGNLEGVVDTGIPGKYYARQVNGQVITVLNAAQIAPIFDLHVLVRRSRFQSNLWQIREVIQDYDVPADQGILAHHHEQHEEEGSDRLALDRKQIAQLTIRVYDAANFIVLVFGGTAITSSGSIKIDHQLIDLSSYVITEGAKFVSIETDEGGVLSVHDGTVFEARAAATAADIPVPDPGKYMIGFVSIYEGQVLVESDIVVPMPLLSNPGNFSDFDHTHELEARDHISELLTLEGFAGAHINQNQYRWNAIASVTISATRYQAYAYWDSDGYMVIGKRVLDGSWTWYTTVIQVTGTDNHDMISIGFDPNGYLHISYDMHAEALKYRRSDSPINTWTGTLTAALSMTGSHETQVTYPTFINDPAGVLYFFFRDGISANGDLYLYKYTHGTTTWAAATGTGSGGLLVKGKGLSPTRNAYWYHPVFDSDFGAGGFLHLAWHWRVTGDTDGANRDPGYVRWDGTSFTKSDGSAQTVPITPANQDTIESTGENLGLTGGNSLYSDSDGNPHVIYPKGAGGARHLYHAYNDGSGWEITQLTTSDSPILGDNNSPVFLQPATVIDRATDTVYVFYIDDRDVPGILAMISDPGDFTTWTRRVIYPYFPGWWGPKLDFDEWERSTILYMPIEFWQGGLSQSLYDSFPIRLLRWDPSLDQFYSFASGVELSDAAPADIASSGIPGSGLLASREDHTHEGVHTVNGMAGDVTIDVTSRELLMQDGVSSPPVPLSNEAGNDWLYEG